MLNKSLYNVYRNNILIRGNLDTAEPKYIRTLKSTIKKNKQIYHDGCK